MTSQRPLSATVIWAVTLGIGAALIPMIARHFRGASEEPRGETVFVRIEFSPSFCLSKSLFRGLFAPYPAFLSIVVAIGMVYVPFTSSDHLYGQKCAQSIEELYQD